MPDTVTRVNLGSGEIPLEGWTNVDAYCPADIIGDMRHLDFGDLEAVHMSHSLEHIPWADVPSLLERIRMWLKPGGEFKCEVPDMGEIMANPGPDWVVYVYGAQSHEGEYHRSGYTTERLGRLLDDAGFHDVTIAAFRSTHPWRPGMPCLEATCHA